MAFYFQSKTNLLFSILSALFFNQLDPVLDFQQTPSLFAMKNGRNLHQDTINFLINGKLQVGSCVQIVYQVEIKFNNKAQIKQQMSHLRVRPLDKPLIIHSLTYNHRPQENDESSEASFLKLSEKNSEELGVLKESSIFEEMQERLNRLEGQSIRKIYDVQARIMAYDNYVKKEEGYGSKVMGDRVQAELTYRCVQRGFQEDTEECNFEMDENRNYVRGSLRDGNSKPIRNFVEAKELRSEPQGQQLILPKSLGRSSNSHSRRSSLCNRSQVSPARKLKQSLNHSASKRKASMSSCKESRANSSRIYEQILSNYSTAKLLAMQKASSDR